jgi:hypothetical protein
LSKTGVEVSQTGRFKTSTYRYLGQSPSGDGKGRKEFVKANCLIAESIARPFAVRATFASNATIAVFPLELPAQGEAAMGKKKETPKRVPFNWPKLKKMAESGASIVQMAEATDPHYRTSESADRTKPTRARLSIAANKGVRIEGRVVRFKRRVKAEQQNQSKRKAEPKKAAPRRCRRPL